MTVEHIWSGAVTHSSAWVRGRTPGASSVRLVVSTDPDLLDPELFPASGVVPTSDSMVSISAEGLSPDTDYFYAFEVDAVVDTTAVGRFRTFSQPGQPASFSFVAASCAGQAGGGGDDSHITDNVSNHPVFDRITALRPLLIAHLGDLNYRNLANSTDDVAQFRTAYDDVLTFNGVEGLDARQAVCYRAAPIAYAGDNHDGTVDSTRPGRDAYVQAYRERVPHYPTGAGNATADPLYQTWRVGRVRFILSDTRSVRSPASDPDGPGKAYLGQAQIDWMRQVLSSDTTSAVLVWLQTQVWHLHAGGAGWNVYNTERQQVAQMLVDTGWADRMCTIHGDIHALGFDSGANNDFGGFPIYQIAPLDADPGAPKTEYDVGYNGARDQFGVFEIRDSGTEVTVTGRAISAGTELFSHSFSVTPAVAQPPAPAPVAQAVIRRRITWFGVHAVTGRIIAELPDVHGKVGRLLSAYSSHELTMPLPRAGPGRIPVALVEQATAAITTAIVAVVNDLPVWMGWVLIRRGGTDPDLRLGTATPEAYLRRRNIRDHTLVDVDRAAVAQILLADAGVLAGVGGGLGFDLDVQDAGGVLDAQYKATDRQPVYEGLRELAADGLEFTVDLDWADSSQTTVRKILRVGPRIGKAAPSGGAPLFETTASGVFESTGGSEATYTLTEDSTTGRYANHVVAVAPGEGEKSPASAPAIDQAALDAGAPIVEHVVEVSSAITDQAALDAIAQAELARLRRGAEVWDISARLSAYPRLGIDAQLGDDVAWVLTGHRHPDGIVGTGRMIGFDVDEQAGRWRPILLDPQVVS